MRLAGGLWLKSDFAPGADQLAMVAAKLCRGSNKAVQAASQQWLADEVEYCQIVIVCSDLKGQVVSMLS